MSHPSREQYLESKVLTASQPQLHLMLLDGALRFGRLAQTLSTEGSDFANLDPLLERMSNIIDELTHGTATATAEISKQLEEQYAFVYRELAACRINQDLEKLNNCLKLLAYQRETWKLANNRLESEAAESTAPAAARSAIMPHMQFDSAQAAVGFSLEA